MDTSKNPPYMFINRRLDYFFRWRWWTAPLIFLPIALGVWFVTAANFDVSISRQLLSVGSGVLVWTLFEYCMHRFFFHFEGDSPRLQHMHYVIHGMHHAYSTDPLRVIFPPFFGMIIGGLVGIIFFLFLPLAIALFVFSGFIIGYVWYECIHYGAHHVKWRSPIFKRLKRHHLLHHHSHGYKESNFGVTTLLWDHVFKTYMP